MSLREILQMKSFKIVFFQTRKTQFLLVNVSEDWLPLFTQSPDLEKNISIVILIQISENYSHSLKVDCVNDERPCMLIGCVKNTLRPISNVKGQRLLVVKSRQYLNNLLESGFEQSQLS